MKALAIFAAVASVVALALAIFGLARLDDAVRDLVLHEVDVKMRVRELEVLRGQP